MRVACVGLATRDTILRVPTLPAHDGRVVADELAVAGGGPAATAAVPLARLGVAGIQATQVPLGVDTAAVRDGRMSLGFDSSVSRLLRHPKFGRIENGATLSLAADTEAVRLDIQSGQVRAVTVRDRTSGETFGIPARHVILAGSCIQSVRLAMASGLDRDDPMVGRYIGDHLFRQAVFRLPEPIGEKSLYIFIPPTAERPFHVQLYHTYSRIITQTSPGR